MQIIDPFLHRPDESFWDGAQESVKTYSLGDSFFFCLVKHCYWAFVRSLTFIVNKVGSGKRL